MTSLNGTDCPEACRHPEGTERPDIRAAIDLMNTGAIMVDDLITHKLPLSDIVKGYRLVVEGRESIKVIITPE